MKITIPAHVLSEALQKCASVIQTRTTLPILGCVAIDAAGDTLTITASSLDAWAICEIPASVTKAGKICLEQKTLAKISAADGELTIEAAPKLKVSISIGKSKFQMSGLAFDEFPKVPKQSGDSIPLSGSEWLTAAARTAVAESTDHTRYSLNGTLLTGSAGSLVFVATDGRCLARHLTENPWTGPDSIVPGSTMRAISAICPEEGEIEISVSDSHISAAAGGDRIVSKPIEGNYPNYNQVIPEYGPETTSVRIDSGDLRRSISTLAPAISDSLNCVTFTTAGAELLSAVNGPEKSGSTSVDAACEGPEISIGLSAALLSSVIRPVSGELTISIIDAMSPVRITEGETLIIVMPMRIK